MAQILRALVAEAILEGLDIVFKGAQIHFQPGVAGGLLLAAAMIRRKGQIGSRNGLAREQAEDQGSQQSFLVHGDSFLLFALDSLDGVGHIGGGLTTTCCYYYDLCHSQQALTGWESTATRVRPTLVRGIKWSILSYVCHHR